MSCLQSTKCIRSKQKLSSQACVDVLAGTWNFLCFSWIWLLYPKQVRFCLKGSDEELKNATRLCDGEEERSKKERVKRKRMIAWNGNIKMKKKVGRKFCISRVYNSVTFFFFSAIFWQRDMVLAYSPHYLFLFLWWLGNISFFSHL